MSDKEINMESVINKHEVEITYIKKALEDLVINSRESSKQLKNISDSIAKQEVILEKIANIEGNHKEAVKRLHDRVDTVEHIVHEEKIDILHKIDLLDKKVEKLRNNLEAKPCSTHSVVNVELDHIKEQLNTHKKIFWTAISALSLGVLSSILELVTYKG